MNIKAMYNELLMTSLILNIFDALLTAGAGFSLGLFIIYFYRIDIFYVILILTIILFIRSIIQKFRENKILILEKRYPNLNERLRTSYDYKERTNEVIDELHSEISQMMTKVDVDAFLSDNKIIVKVAVICMMMSATLYLSSIGLDVLDLKNAIVNSAAFKKTTGFVAGLFDETRDEVKNRPLLDKPRLIATGDKDLNISIETYNTELDINNIGSPEKNDFGGSYPQEVAGAAQETYQENIPEDYKDVVKEYFKKINK